MRQLKLLKIGLVILQIVAAIAVTANAGFSFYTSIQKIDPLSIKPPSINFLQKKSCTKDAISFINDCPNDDLPKL